MSKLKKFLDGRRNGYLAPNFDSKIKCPDCHAALFKGEQWVACICFGDLKSGIKLTKSENGVKVAFSNKWDIENIELLLSVLRNITNDIK